MEQMLKVIDSISAWIWGWPMLVILAGGSVVMTAYLGFFQFRYVGYITKETFGKIFSKKESEGEGTVSPVQAVISALGATIGGGNLVGVGVAIGLGGPGAVFWMWVICIFGCAYKYAEIALGIKYRTTNSEGEFIGGPMYYLSRCKKLPWLGSLYALIFVIELTGGIGNQAAGIVDTALVVGVPRIISTIVIVVFILLTVYGGIKSLVKVMEKMVPSMTIIFMVASSIILLIHFKEIPAAFALIFKSAFTGTAASGAFAGVTVAQALRWGLARGVGTNDAGNGQSAIAHAAAITDHPGRQAMWGIFEVILDTLIMCTITALTIIVTGAWEVVDPTMSSTMATVAFQTLGGKYGAMLMAFISFLFCMATIIVLFFYGEKLAEYLFGTKISKITKYFYLIFVILGCMGGVDKIVRYLDILFAGIIIPNVIGMFILRKEIKEITVDFFEVKSFEKNKVTKGE